VGNELKARKAKHEAEQFRAWCAMLDGMPPRVKRRLKPGYLAAVELQPHRWLSAGIDLLRSAHVTGYVQLMNGQQGEPLQSFLPYSVFQAGTEVFLKGMWLCQFPSCRRVAHASYVGIQSRKRIDDRLRQQSHDLLKLIGRLRRVKRYREDVKSMQFLRRISAITRLYYFPVHQAGRGSWATARYPKRFYNDVRKEGHADGYNSYPEQRLVQALFAPMSHHLDGLWNLRRGLLESRKRRTAPNREAI
jgi:hypothetical protein